MASHVYLHLGVPKSGTTHLQTTLWSHRDELAERGVLLPGGRHAHHRWPSYVVREQVPQSPAHGVRLSRSHERLLRETREWPGTVLVSHEFYGAASAAQAERFLAELAPAEVHLVVTVRDALSLLTASWQESLKYASTTSLDDFAHGVSDDPFDVWGWRNLDASEVLSRWAVTVPPERVHVVVVPRDRAAPTSLWERFAGLLVADPGAFEPAGRSNQSMGVVESELLRSVNVHLPAATGPVPTLGLLRDHLANERLVPRGGERFRPGPERVVECRERSRAMVERIRAASYDVVGDLDDLLVPADLPPRRTPADVGAAELADEGAAVVADLLADLHAARAETAAARRRVVRLRRRLRRARRAVPAPGLRARVLAVWPRSQR